jgi:hypothetical protein
VYLFWEKVNVLKDSEFLDGQNLRLLSEDRMESFVSKVALKSPIRISEITSSEVEALTFDRLIFCGYDF